MTLSIQELCDNAHFNVDPEVREEMEMRARAFGAAWASEGLEVVESGGTETQIEHNRKIGAIVAQLDHAFIR
jgi:hypothetical protein